MATKKRRPKSRGKSVEARRRKRLWERAKGDPVDKILQKLKRDRRADLVVLKVNADGCRADIEDWGPGDSHHFGNGKSPRAALMAALKKWVEAV